MHLFRNWAGTATAQPHALHSPNGESEIVAIVRAAAQAGRRVKVVGAGHSWSDIACTDGDLLQLDGMGRVLRVDLERRQITVQAGIRLHRLIAALHRYGLTLPVIGSVTQQSIAGAIATGTHGSAPELGNLASRVVGLRMVLADGDVLSVNAAENPELLPAVRVHLGALGVLSEVTLAAVPAFRLREELSTLPFADAIAQLPQLVDSAPYVKLWWLPHAQQVLLSRCWPTDEPQNLSRLAWWIDEQIVNRHVFAGVLRISARSPARIPLLNRVVAAAYFRPRKRCGENTAILPVPMPPIHDETEYALPREQAGAALSALRGLIEDHSLHINFPAELRFVAADDGWLSPMSGRSSACLGAYIGPDMPSERERYFSAFAERMQDFAARPHWGKAFRHRADYLRTVYPDYDRFVALRDRLDPQRRFQNDFLSRVLGD
jgi:FAD-linked oxidoreductase